MGVQIVADPDLALGLTVARMIREGLYLARPVHVRALGGGAGPAVPRTSRGCRCRVARIRSRRWRGGPSALAAVADCRPAAVWVARPCRAPDSAHRRAGCRGPAPHTSGSQSPPPAAPVDSTAASDARASIRFLAHSAPSRNGCGPQSPAPPARGPVPATSHAPGPAGGVARGALAGRSRTSAGPFSTAWRGQRPTLRADTSKVAAIASSGQPSPSGPSSYCNRARARSLCHPGRCRCPPRPLAI